MSDEPLNAGAPFRLAKPKVVSDGPVEAKRGPGRPRTVPFDPGDLPDDIPTEVIVADSPLVVLRSIARMLKQYEDIEVRREIVRTLVALLD